VDEALRLGGRAVDLIAAKRQGAHHEPAALRWLVESYLNGEVPDYQMAAWLMAVCWRGLDGDETSALTMALADSGRRLSFADAPLPVVDKHSTGGVGDKTTLVLAPMLAAAGVAVAKMSGRGLGHTGGTIDKLESIPGVSTTVDADAFARQVVTHGLAIAAQSAELAPGDGRLYALRDVTATVESVPLIASSVMSKKIATGAHAVVLDVKTGSGAFMKDRRGARALAEAMVALGRQVGLPTVAVMSDMTEPLGLAIGNGLEVQEAIASLQGNGPADLMQLCLTLGSEVMCAAGAAHSLDAARSRLADAVAGGAALKGLLDLVGRLGGDPQSLLGPDGLPRAPVTLDLPAPTDGYVAAIDALACGLVAMRLGAGRSKKGDAIDPAVGLVLNVKIGDAVARGAPLATLHAREPISVDSEPAQLLLGAFAFSSHPVAPPPLLLETIR
jgi:pyrimidine-nucleoside phosphorylase